MLTAIDNNLVEATRLLGSQAGRTSDTITRDILHTGTNVLYANNKVARSALVQGTDKLTVRDIRKATRKLKLLNTPMIGGYYIGIIHPDLAFDLMDDNDWKYPHQYVDTKNIYMGELGAIAGVRFSETTEAKVIKAEELPGATGGAYTVASYSSKVITISDELTSANATALVGKTINVGTEAYTVTAATAYVAGSPATAATITIKETPGTDPAANDKVYAVNAGKGGANVYGTLILGDNAYGVTDITGGGLQHSVKQLGSSGTADPLNQRATVGWKLMKTACIRVQEYMVRIESTSSFATTESN
jgi:N4-gp56 family major capsid protein